MDIEAVKEYRKLRERIVQLKNNINIGFNHYIGFEVPFNCRSQKNIELEYKMLCSEIDMLGRRIKVLLEKNANDLIIIKDLQKSVFISVHNDEGKHLDSFNKTDDLSSEKQKLLDTINKEIETRKTEIEELRYNEESYIRAKVIDVYHMHPYGITLNNNFRALNSLEIAIQDALFDKDYQTFFQKLSIYNEALSKVDGTEEQFSKVVDLITNDSNGLSNTNILEKIPEILKSKPHTKEKIPKSPLQAKQ